MPFPYKNPISPIQVLGPQSVDRSVVFGTHFSTNGTGGYMEVFSLSGLTYEIPIGQTGSIESSGNTIPINFIIGNGTPYSPDVLILNSDNISSGRRKLGMIAYVYEEDQVYQYDIPNYEQLWTAATASTNCVVINEFGTTVRNNTTEGQAFINAWTASTIEGVNGIVRANARWKKYWGNNLSVTGGSYNGLTTTLTLVNITGGTVDITGFGPGGGGGQFTAGTFSQPNLEITLTSTGGSLTITGVTGLYISGGSYSSGNTTLSLFNSTGGTLTITGFSQTFSGGSGNCINQLYLNEIYPCTSDIKIQPLSAGKVYFGLSNAASGFTVDLVTDTSYEATRLGLNTNSPQYTFDFYGRDRKNRFYYRDNLTGAGLVDIKNIIFSGDSDVTSQYTVVSSDESGQQGAHGISIGIRGYNAASSILNNGVGKTGDSFITAFADTNGLNIINGPATPGVTTEDYIRFYAGQLVNNNTPDIHIQGSGATRGFVGINKTGVTNQLHVFASSNPVRFEGLQSSANTRYLVADSDGVVTYTTASPGGGGGDSITGGTYNQNNLNLELSSTASTITITGVTGLYISGGSYTSGNTTLTLSNSTGGTLTITGFSQTFSGGSGNCINQLYLNEIYPCTSDIKIQPLSAGKVFFGSLSGASGFTVDLVSDTGYTTTRLGLNNSLPDYTIDFYSRDRKNRLYLLDNLTNIYSASDDAAYGPGQPPRMIIVTTPGIDNSLAGTPITVYNSAGDSETRILNGVITPSPSPGFSRLNFAGSLWAEDYRQAAGGYFVFPLSSGIGDSEIKNLIFSGKSDTNSSFSVTGPNRSELQGFHGISIGIRGYTTSGTALNNKVGVTGDSFIQVFPGTNGLNIINEVGTDTDDYIRFYAGRNFIDNTPDIHIQGSGATRGFVGINTTGVTNQLHVSATTNPLRLEGLQESGLTRYLVADSNGVVYYTTGSTSGSSSGFTTVSINGITQFTSLTSQTINFSGINITITSAATNTLVFSSATSSGNIQQNKIVLRKVDLGSRNVTGNTQPNIPYNLFNVLVRSELWDPLSGKTQQYFGSVLNYYMTVNDNNGDRKKILFSSDTLTNTFLPQTALNVFSAMTDYKVATFTSTTFANFYCELVLNLDSQYSSPTQIKLVNPLFNSFNARKYSRSTNWVGKYEFVTNFQGAHNLFENFALNFPSYYNTSTSNDITKNIYNIVSNEPTFYGSLSGEAQSAIINTPWDTTSREIIQNSVFVEHLTNFYSTYKIPTNLYKGWNFSQVYQNNYFAEILYDIVGGSSSSVSSFASAPTYGSNSSAFLQLVDTYRILPSGNRFVIYGEAETLKLSGLTYEVYDKQKWKYINGGERANKTGQFGKTGIQVLPGYNEIYVLELEVIGTPGGTNATTFYNSLLVNYFVANNPSVKLNNGTWTNSNYSANALVILSDSTTFNSNAYGPYIIIQSTDEKMQTLSLTANSLNDYGVGEINVKAIYKGHTFRPEIYPLNLSQLILEVPESFFYNGSTLQASENSSNNIFELSGVDVTNKKLRLVVKYTKLNKWDIINLGLKYTVKRGLTDNSIFTLTIDEGAASNSFEVLLVRGISWNRTKELRPGSVEIYFAFYDVNTYKTSLIPNYKIVIVNYGDNEIFKLIRGDAEINAVIP